MILRFAIKEQLTGGAEMLNADERGGKYNDAPFVGDILLAMVNEISRRAKTR